MLRVGRRPEFLAEVKKLLPERPVCVEIGVARGDFAVMINAALQPSKLFLVDSWQIDATKTYAAGFGGYAPGKTPTSYCTARQLRWTRGKLQAEIDAGIVETVQKFSYDAVRDFADNYFDFVYIDACHLYEDVQRDLRDWYPKLKKGGLLCGHDYKVIPDIAYSDYGVIRAVDEFCAEHKYEICVLARHGDFVIVV